MSAISRGVVFGAAAMAVVVTASNVLVQIPLGDLLTWGAFTYPVAFLVTDLTNRALGPAAARKVVYAGFAVAVALSAMLASPRIALASGAAFLSAQLLDVAVFNHLRDGAWWRAPLVSSTIAGVLDTAIFFSVAFAAHLAVLGVSDPFVAETIPLLDVLPVEAPRWVSWAIGDFSVKMCVALTMLIPFRAALALIGRAPAQRRT